MTRLHLSPPHMTGAELELVREALTPAAIADLRRRGFTSYSNAQIPGVPEAPNGRRNQNTLYYNPLSGSLQIRNNKPHL